MRLRFTGELWYRRGPSPFYFVTVPADESELIHSISPTVTYGWGMIPCEVRVGRTRWSTSLWPKDGGYVLPVKAAVHEAERLGVDDLVAVELQVASRVGA